MDLSCNPFYILAAATQDSRQRIMELADGCSLAQDPVQCRESAASLTHPRRRLLAEVSWLPVKNSEQAENICGLLKSSEGSLGALDRLRQVQNLLGADELMPIAKSNVLAAGLSRLPRHSSHEIETWILELACASEDIDAGQVCTVINADRKVSGFPVVNLQHIKAEIQELQKNYLRVMTSVLKKLSGKERAAAITEVIESATDSIQGMRMIASIRASMLGVVESATDDEKQFPRLIDRLVDWHELDAQISFKEYETKIDQLDKKLRLAADKKHHDSVLASLVNQLTDAINNWHAVAHPIQINKKNKGLPHEDSKRVEKRVRGLALHLFHDYNKLSFCQQLIVTLQAVFADVVEISEALANDMNQLENIARRRGQKALDEFTRIREHRARQDVKIQLQNLRSAAYANQSKFSISRMANRLILSVKKWKPLALPISASNTNYRNIANIVRDLALYLRNEHGNLNISLRLLKMLQKEFAEIGEVAKLVDEDVKALEAPEQAHLNVKTGIRKLRAAAAGKKPDSIFNPMLHQLIQSVKEWKTLAQPLESYRTDHYNVANRVRKLARHLWHKHGKISHTRELMKMLQEVFAEIAEITRLVAEDIKALDATENARLNIQTQIDTLRAANDAKEPDSILSPMVNQLIQSVKIWKALAQPVNAYQSDYYQVANLVRELALHLWNEHGKLDVSRQLLKMLKVEFGDVGEIAALVEEHLDALEAPKRERLNVEALVKKLRTAADANKPDSILSPMVNQLIQTIKEWKTLAQPIKAYHVDCHNIANVVRELALHLWKEHGKLDLSRQLFNMLQEEFAAVREINTLIAKDIDALEAPERARIDVQKQTEKLQAAVDEKKPNSILTPMVNQLIQSVKKWKTLAQPIKAYYGDYRNVTNLVRELAQHLWTKHGTLDFARQLLEALQEEFAEIREFAALIAEDLKTLEAPERALLDVQAQAEKLRAAADAKKPESILSHMVTQLIKSVKEWKTLAQPFKAYIADYYNVATLVRELALHLRPEQDKLNSSHKFTEMLQKLFVEVAEITTLIREEAKSLDETIEEYVRPIAKERTNPPEGMIEAVVIGILMALLLVVLAQYF